MLLDAAHIALGWPQPGQVLQPTGSGAGVYAAQAKQKIGEVLSRSNPGLIVETGILTADENSKSAEAPIAIVCQFPLGTTDDVLDEVHRLAWNFSRTALLITLEPHRLIAWSCCQDPKQARSRRRVCELPSSSENDIFGDPQQRGVADLLHWVSLLTGQILRRNPGRFQSSGRADSCLLRNLREIRRQLLADGMPERYCHDLLARIIFTQFLFHRKDADGRAFFDERLLAGRCDGVLKRVHKNLASILANKDETYALFRWLDDRFNGDLFPGVESQTEAERDLAWQEEKDAITDDHLRLLADFVSGGLELATFQSSLWPQYSFDTIPLEFISSVYEEFLNEEKFRDKAYYTPGYLVDFVLDGVLPWEGKVWDMKILDPSCGSGIFLVKAFQRLIHRWRTAHPGRDLLVSDLKPILANNFIGVDKNPEAVRVACFSLYLAMADAIEPKYYLKREKVFPRLRGTRLIAQDFFDEGTKGIQTVGDARTYHLVVGNAPWGDKSIKGSSEPISDADPVPSEDEEETPPTKAEKWAEDHHWPVANNDIGPVFLGKAAKLVRFEGQVAMIQSASTLLHQRAGSADKLRKKLFTEFCVDEITNLTAIRREIFNSATGAACVIIFGVSTPEPLRPLLYCAPKPHLGGKGQRALIIEPHDVNQITHSEAATEPMIWTVLISGGRRDWLLVRRLREMPTLEKLETAHQIATRLGVIPGKKNRRELPELEGKPYFELPAFPNDAFLHLEADNVPKWNKPRVAFKDSTKTDAFLQPQMLIKQSFSATEGRYRAKHVRSSDPVWGVVCKKTYFSVHDLAQDARHIKAATIIYNSRFAAYFLNLTSSRSLYNTELLSTEVKCLPLPLSLAGQVEPRSFAEVDQLVEAALALNAAESILLEDFLDVTLPSLLQKKPGLGHKRTSRREKSSKEPELIAYAKIFVQVVKNTFGSKKAVSATIFQEDGSQLLPVRMIGIHLDWSERSGVSVERIENGALYKQLQSLYSGVLQAPERANSGEGLGFQRVAFLFNSHQEGQRTVHSLYIIKPDERRYWLRSLAMRDADQLSAAILKAGSKNTSAA